MIELEDSRFRLTIPVIDAVAFAMGWSDLGYRNPDDGLRHVIGALALDALEYSEQWRIAAQTRMCLARKWPACFGS